LPVSEKQFKSVQGKTSLVIGATFTAQTNDAGRCLILPVVLLISVDSLAGS